MRRSSQLLACTFLLVFTINFSYGQVNADFVANITEGCGSLQVSFTDLSTSTAGSITSWSWDLGSSVTSSIKNPGRIYGNPGSYTICLTATDSEGNLDTECKIGYITIFELPQPDFSADPSIGCSPLDVEFTDLSISNDGNITQWIWGIGGTAGVIVDDGTIPEISSTYTSPDTYTISLTVSDDNGCINTITKNNFVTVSEDPVVDVSAPVTFSCTNPFIVDFTNNGDTQDMTYLWDFGNDTYSNLTDPGPVVYNDFGSHTVTVTVTNTISGCSETLVLEDYIQVGYPIDFDYSTDAGCEDLSVSFTDNSIDPASVVIWDFGDNTGTSSEANPTHLYTEPGCYTVTLTREVNGCSAFETSDVCIEVFEMPSIAYANNNPIGCTVPHTVAFESFTNNGIEWAWDFGDGTGTSNVQNPVYTFNSFGAHTVNLTITNANGCSSSISTDVILIQEIQALIPTDTLEGCTPLDISLSSISTSPTAINSWEWILTNNSTSPPEIETSSSSNPDFTLVDTGYYEIKLIVGNNIGCSDTSTYTQLIAVGQQPIIDFEADPEISCVETPVTFTDQTSDNADDWIWEFGDGGFGTGEITEHEYLDTGYFDVTLYAYHHSCENVLTIDSFVQINPPIATMAVGRFCETPYYIELIDNSVGADSIFWDFGIDGIDTDTSSMREPTFTYPQTGDFTITMTVFNFDTGCSDDQTFFIQIRDVNADFNIIPPLEGCVPMTVQFDESSQDGNVYEWSAPGGSFSNASIHEPDLTYTTPGKYTDIQLVVTDQNGCQDTLIFQDTITANGISPDFTIDPSEGCRPLTVSFTDQSSSVYGNLTDWVWSFSGGAPVEHIQNPTTVFEEIGTYTVRLAVTDDWGCTAVQFIADGVDVTYPLVDFYADTLSCTSLEVDFQNTSVGKSMTYLWDFGDNQTSTDEHPTHLYQFEGIYDVCLTATDANGCDSTFCKNDYIVIADPIANLAGDSVYATCPPLIVNFDNQSLNSDQYIWDFGDNSGTSNLENPPHVYTQPGIYDLTLIASFQGHCADTLFIDDYISVEGPVGSFTFDIDSACIPAIITFYGESVDFYDYTWDFGNGIIETTNNVMYDTMEYEYDMIGQFVPKLILEDHNSCLRVFESPDTIRLEELTLDYAVTDSIICTGESSTTFLNLMNSSLNVNSIEWIFDGGNPGTSNAFEPVVSYDTAGVFDVILIASNGFCTDTLIKPAAIKVGETPEAAFAMNDTLGCPPFAVTFSDLSTVSSGYIAGWEWDYGDNSNSYTQNPTHVFDEEGSFDVALTVTTDIGCTDDITNTIGVYPPPQVQVPEPYNICIGNVVELEVEFLTDTTGVIYHWLPDPTLSCTNCLSPQVNPIDTTVYYFVAENSIGCTDTSQVVVEVRPFPAPIIDMSNDTTICANSIIQITADGGTSVFEYQWDASSPGLSCYDNCFNPIASPEVSTTYVVTVTNEYECVTIEDVLVEVIDEYQPFAGADKTICEGSSTQLNITFGNDPVWMVTEGLSCAYCPDPIASPEETTTYLVEVTTDMGCEVIDTIVINIMEESEVDAGTDHVICLGERIELDAIGEGQIVWSPANSLDDNTIINPLASPTTSTTYVLSVTNDECTMIDSVSIGVAERAEVFAENQTICLGESVMLEAYGDAETFLWSPATTLSDPMIANPIASPTETTTYVVTGSLSTCLDDSAEITVEVIPGPETQLTEIYDFFPEQTVEVEVNTNGNGAYIYEWSPIDLVSCVSCNNPQIVPDSTMSLYVRVVDPITSCWTIDTTILRLNNDCPTDLIGVPNIFTPNNDGFNDKLELHLSPAIQETGIDMFRIFDRWGALVFETKNANDAWDGTFKGKKLPSGVYVYYIEAPCPIGEGKILKKGDITLFK